LVLKFGPNSSPTHQSTVERKYPPPETENNSKGKGPV
jgi:hypothetical protein